jgi:enoyl-CoA hydratase/carnithine racemase
MARAMSAVLDALLDLPFVSVAAIDGLAVGGGAELVTACDYRVGGADGAIHFVHGELGVAPGWGGTQRLVNLVGRRHALRILTGARLLRMGEAERFGLVDLRADGSIVDAALSWLEPVRRLPQPAVAALKQQVVAAARGEGAEVQAERFAEVWRGPAHEQALARLARHRT